VFENVVATRESLVRRAVGLATFTVLGGLLLNATLGWWWADPVAALGIVVFLAREGRETLSAEHVDDCC
jgi:divalent metal cation (Fe/Co/Zn/Cd) transporter